MVEKVYTMTMGDEAVFEQVIADENLQYSHIIFHKGEGPAPHNTDSNAYVTVLRGTMSVTLADQGVKVYEAGTIMNVPIETEMSIKNLHDSVLELIIVKAPPPA